MTLEDSFGPAGLALDMDRRLLRGIGTPFGGDIAPGLVARELVVGRQQPATYDIVVSLDRPHPTHRVET